MKAGMASLLFAGVIFFVLTAQAGSDSRYIAVSDTEMNHSDAVKWCAAKGGRLPLVDGKSSSSYSEKKTAFIDGIGSVNKKPWNTPWSKTGLPEGLYWTGTASAVAPGPGYSLVVSGAKGVVIIVSLPKSNSHRAFCVPYGIDKGLKNSAQTK